ncbi:MAG: hypothetical protein C5B55_07790 [Blastocatellia bacterium]|nr:MAG: hypothetical protein C5B55_07790 [Blastocatellia bacterium]
MKTQILLLALFLLFFTSTLYGQVPKTNQILADFRTDKASVTPKISKATERMVLSKMFRRYLTDSNKCDSNFEPGNGNDYLAAARKAGQIVPSIVDSAQGSFTAPGQTQTAYVVSVSECNASHADNFGTKRIAIFAGNQLVADVDVDFKDSIIKKTDLNADGVDELLMSSGYMGQGELVESAALLGFDNGKMHVIQDLGTVNDDSCASELPGSSARASVISFGGITPGQMPKLRMDNYKTACKGPRRWRFFSTGKMPEQ